MGRPKANTTKITLSLSEKAIKALDYFSNHIGLSKSQIVSLSLINYFMSKDEFRNNSKWEEIVGKEEIEIFEKSNRIKKLSK